MSLIGEISFCIIVFASFITSVEAQSISENAIGVRFGDNDGIGAEINYQRGISENNRLEFGFVRAI